MLKDEEVYEHENGVLKQKENSANMELDTLNDNSGSKEHKERETWDRKIEYILSMVGYIVGLGNFWRFPYLCMRNGGGAFLFPFVVCCIFIAFPIFFLEVSVGQFTAKSIIHCWEACPLFKGVGIGMVIINVICALYYVMVVTWTLYYLYSSFTSPLPWTTCGNDWNSDSCHADNDMIRQNLSNQSIVISSNTTITSQEEFWQNRVLDMSSGIEEMGTINTSILICLFISWLIIFLCLMKGVKSVGKVVYVTATLPYILMIVLLVRGVTLPGAANGIKYYIYPNFSKIADEKVWIEAAIQVFYSTCVCWGPLITMASYNKFHNNCLRDTIMLITMGEGFSVFGGFVVFSVLGFMAHENGVDIEEVVKSGPGLIYVAYPEVVSRLPLPNLWAVIFFIMILTIGLDSQFAGCEPIIAVLCDSYQIVRRRRVLFTAIIMVIFFLFGLPFCFQGGIFVFQLMDWYIAAFCIPVFGIIECVVFGWIYGADNFSRDVELMIGRPIPILIRILWCFVTPVLLFILLVMIVKDYEPPTYGAYSYPKIANSLGLVYALIPLLPVFVMAVSVISNAQGDSLLERIQFSLRPSSRWHPGNKEESNLYLEHERLNTSSSFQRRLKGILLDR